MNVQVGRHRWNVRGPNGQLVSINPRIEVGAATGGAVESVDGQTGVVDLSASYASFAQGGLADTSVQPAALAGKADLVGGVVPAGQLPGFVDDVVEFADLGSFPVSGEAGKLYIAVDTNLVYRWGGTNYVMTSSALALGETSVTAFRGDRGKTAYEHSQITAANPHEVTPGLIGAATTAQGATADSALQSSDVALVAFSGSYDDLDDKPTTSGLTIIEMQVFS